MNTDNDHVTSLHTNTPLTINHCTDQCTTHHREQSADKLSWQYNLQHSPMLYNLQLPPSTNPMCTMKSKTTDNSTPQYTETSTRNHNLLAELLEGTRALSHFMLTGRYAPVASIRTQVKLCSFCCELLTCSQN